MSMWWWSVVFERAQLSSQRRHASAVHRARVPRTAGTEGCRVPSSTLRTTHQNQFTSRRRKKTSLSIRPRKPPKSDGETVQAAAGKRFAWGVLCTVRIKSVRTSLGSGLPELLDFRNLSVRGLSERILFFHASCSDIRIPI